MGVVKKGRGRGNDVIICSKSKRNNLKKNVSKDKISE